MARKGYSNENMLKLLPEIDVQIHDSLDKKKLKVAINNIVGVVASGQASAALLTKLTAFEEDLEVLEKLHNRRN